VKESFSRRHGSEAKGSDVRAAVADVTDHGALNRVIDEAADT